MCVKLGIKICLYMLVVMEVFAMVGGLDDGGGCGDDSGCSGYRVVMTMVTVVVLVVMMLLMVVVVMLSY